MSDTSIPHPKIVTQNEWLVARKAHLEREKEITCQFDRLRGERRRLPMVKIEKNYVFDGPNGKRTLRDLFEGRQQLIVYHFMFDPQWEKGCPGCTLYVDALGDLSMLNERNTTFAVISRAPLSKLGPTRRSEDGPFLGIPPSTATSTMTFMSRWMKLWRPASITIEARQNST